MIITKVSTSNVFAGNENLKTQNNVSNTGFSLKTLKKDTVSFKSAPALQTDSKFVDESDVNRLAREFSNQVNILYRETGQLNCNKLQNLVNKLLDGKGDVQVQHMSQYEMNAAAYCASGIDKKGNPKTALFVDFTTPVPDLIENLVHEFTHVLQICTESQTKLMQESLARGQEKHFALEEAANTFEDKILYVVNEVLPRYEDEINTRLSNNAITLESVADHYKFITPEMLQKGLEEVSKHYGLENDTFALKYFLSKAQKEAQAYRQGHVSLKEAHGFSGVRCAFDLIPVFYDKCATFLQEKLEQTKPENNKPLMLFA